MVGMTMKNKLFWVGFLALILTLNACTAGQYLGNTTASATKDGFNYASNKNQENFHAVGDYDPVTGKVHFEASTTAATPDAAIAAALQSNLAAQQQVGDILKAILPLVAAAAKTAAIGASGGAAAVVP
jgi:hypothetical protein